MSTLKRNLILFFFLFTNTQIVFGQDTIFYSNGNKEIIEMMQISGDTIQFRIDTVVQRISTNKVLKITYQNGNLTNFNIPVLVSTKPKVKLIAGYPDLPLYLLNSKVFLNYKKLSNPEFVAIMRLQNDLQIQKKCKKYEYSTAARNLLLGIAIGGIAVPFNYYHLYQQFALNSLGQKVNLKSRYILAGVWAASVFFSISLNNSSQLKKTELIELYNSTYYK